MWLFLFLSHLFPFALLLSCLSNWLWQIWCLWRLLRPLPFLLEPWSWEESLSEYHMRREANCQSLELFPIMQYVSDKPPRPSLPIELLEQLTHEQEQRTSLVSHQVGKKELWYWRFQYLFNNREGCNAPSVTWCPTVSRSRYSNCRKENKCMCQTDPDSMFNHTFWLIRLIHILNCKYIRNNYILWFTKYMFT